LILLVKGLINLKQHLTGIEVLRGIGIFGVAALHSMFYYFSGLFEVDLDNPPIIVTIIGLLLMFAGLFAMISGFVHNLQYDRRLEMKVPPAQILKHRLAAGGFVLIVAYIYFIFTGPGLAIFETSSFDNSILVELIRNGRFAGLSQARLLYVDSLVMIGMNIILCALIAHFANRIVRNRERLPAIYLISGCLVFALSLVRIPLYEIYLKAVEMQNLPAVLALNWLVNKNNPILPFLAFGLFGMWIAESALQKGIRGIFKRILPVAAPMLIAGIALYILLPDTMLKRGIDPLWYAIMLAQLGLFSMIIAGFIYFYDGRKDGGGKTSRLTRYFTRFGVAGLTVFFLESVVSACVYRILQLTIPGLAFSMTEAIIYGICLASVWGFALMLWEKSNYKYGLEYWYSRLTGRFGGSTKDAELKSRRMNMQ
jgi:hypothetical protein